MLSEGDPEYRVCRRNGDGKRDNEAASANARCSKLFLVVSVFLTPH